METATYRAYIGIIENNMEATTYRVVYGDNGNENGSYYM